MANTPADRSKRATQLSPGAALPALCLLVPGRFGFAVHQTGDSVYGILRKSCPVHQIGDSVYGYKDYDENGQEKGGLFWPLEEELTWRPGKGAIFWPFCELMRRLRQGCLFWGCLVFGGVSQVCSRVLELVLILILILILILMPSHIVLKMC